MRLHPAAKRDIEQILIGGSRRFDKSGEYFYDQISALHKSVRGSNPDAALYWLCRMLMVDVIHSILLEEL